MKRSLIFVIFSLLVLAQLGLAQMPQTISYQGVLRDATTGDIVADDDYDVIFSLYDNIGNSVWSETHSVSTGNPVTVTDGLFSVILGKVTPIFNLTAPPVELGIKVGTDEELDPHIELTAVPYSLQAGSVSGPDNVFPGSGYVGIGTTTPETKLHIASPNADGIILTDSSSGLYSASLFNFETVGGSFNLNDATGAIQAKIRGYEVDGVQAFFNAGNVGIGTTTPSAELEVVGGIKADSLILPATTRYYSIPVSAFMPSSDDTGYYRSLNHLYPTDWPAEFLAPLNLPDGAVIKELQVTVDDDSTSNILANLYGTTLSTGNTGQYASLSSAGIEGVGTASSGTLSVAVNNQTYAYMVRVYFPTKGSTDGFCVYGGALIKYTVTTPLP